MQPNLPLDARISDVYRCIELDQDIENLQRMHAMADDELALAFWSQKLSPPFKLKGRRYIRGTEVRPPQFGVPFMEH